MNYVDLGEQVERQPLDLIEAHNDLSRAKSFALTLPSDRPGIRQALEPILSHPHFEQAWVALYTRSSDIIAGKQADTVHNTLRKAFGTFEHNMRERQEKRKEHWGRQNVLDRPADVLINMGILLGEVCDDKVIEEMLAAGAESYSG